MNKTAIVLSALVTLFFNIQVNSGQTISKSGSSTGAEKKGSSSEVSKEPKLLQARNQQQELLNPKPVQVLK